MSQWCFTTRTKLPGVFCEKLQSRPTYCCVSLLKWQRVLRFRFGSTLPLVFVRTKTDERPEDPEFSEQVVDVMQFAETRMSKCRAAIQTAGLCMLKLRRLFNKDVRRMVLQLVWESWWFDAWGYEKLSCDGEIRHSAISLATNDRPEQPLEFCMQMFTGRNDICFAILDHCW